MRKQWWFKEKAMTSLVSFGALWRSLQGWMLKISCFPSTVKPWEGGTLLHMQLLLRSSSLGACIWQLARRHWLCQIWPQLIPDAVKYRAWITRCWECASLEDHQPKITKTCWQFAMNLPVPGFVEAWPYTKRSLHESTLCYQPCSWCRWHNSYRKSVSEGSKLCIQKHAIILAMLRHGNVLGSQARKHGTEEMNVLHHLGAMALWNVAVSLLRKQSSQISSWWFMMGHVSSCCAGHQSLGWLHYQHILVSLSHQHICLPSLPFPLSWDTCLLSSTKQTDMASFWAYLTPTLS